MSIIPPRPRIFEDSCCLLRDVDSLCKEGDFLVSIETGQGFYLCSHADKNGSFLTRHSALNILSSPEFAVLLENRGCSKDSIYRHAKFAPPIANCFAFYSNILTCTKLKSDVHLFVSGEDEGLIDHVFGGDTRIPTWIHCFDVVYRRGQIIKVGICPLTRMGLSWFSWQLYESGSSFVDTFFQYTPRWGTVQQCFSLLVDCDSEYENWRFAEHYGVRRHLSDLLIVINGESKMDIGLIDAYRYPNKYGRRPGKGRTLHQVVMACDSQFIDRALEIVNREFWADPDRCGRQIVRIRKERTPDMMPRQSTCNADSAGPEWLPNAELRWPFHVYHMTSSVIALLPLNLPAYVLLWVLNLTSAWIRSLPEARKISYIQGLVESYRAVLEKRKNRVRRYRRRGKK
jgi:hypothetical protein